jgi:hypothetical protein
MDEFGDGGYQGAWVPETKPLRPSYAPAARACVFCAIVLLSVGLGFAAHQFF